MASAYARYSLTELAGLASVTPRTVRYYMSQGLLPSPGASGPGAKYDDAHLGRLRVIRKLQREHLPLAEIRRRLAGLNDTTITALAEEPASAETPQDTALDYIRRLLGSGRGARVEPMLARAAEASPGYALAPTSPATPPPRAAMSFGPEPTTDHPLERSQWERISLAPDIELHVRRPLPRPLAKRVDRLVSIARDLLEEDPS